MKIAVIVPDRGDRPEFLKNCKRMIAAQTLQPDQVVIADYKPISDRCDITWRYRTAYHSLDGMGFDCILFMENDDYYQPEYIEKMVSAWEKHGNPEIFGCNYTVYYHVGLRRWEFLQHFRRSSAMNTLIKPDLKIKWPVDHEPYTDIHLWQQLKGVTFDPKEHLCIGIKHGIGLSGGHYHNTKLDRYKNSDPEMKLLSDVCDSESFTFYKSLHEKIQSNFNRS